MSHSIGEPNILLLHDGELADVAALLRALGAAMTERRGGPAAEDAEQSWRLVVASARRALEVPTSVLRASALHLAILDGESRTVLALLRRASFELVVRRPVHPAALRLLLLHSLYRGPEKRRTPRVSVGAPVHVRAGLRRHPAILAEISERGCRLLSSQRVSLGQTLTLQIPAVLAGGRGFSVKGLVVRTIPAQIGAAGVLTLEFDPLRGALRDHMRALVSAHSGGPSALARSEANVDAPRPYASAPAPIAVVASPLAGTHVAPGTSLPVAAASERHLEPPAAAREPIEAPGESGALTLAADLEADLAPDPEPDLVSDLEVELGDELEAPALPRRLVPLSREASRVILARGLSREGMRADPSLRLTHSAELSLALHVDVGGPPLHVRAHVEPGAAGAPDPGPWLRFTELAPGDGERLDALLAGLAIFAGGDGPEHALVVCEILEPPHG